MSDTSIGILIISAAVIVWAVRKYKKEIAKYLPQILPYVTPSWVPFYKKVDEPGEKDGDKKPGKKPDKKKESKKTSWWSALLILLGVNIALTLLFPAFYGWGWTNWQSVMGINVVIIIMALIAHRDGWFLKTVCVLGLLLVGFGWFLNYTPTGKDLATEWDNLQKLREAEKREVKEDTNTIGRPGEKEIEAPLNEWSDWVTISKETEMKFWTTSASPSEKGWVKVESSQSGEVKSSPEDLNFVNDRHWEERKYRFMSLDPKPVKVFITWQ
ncbi:MAG: hypothetical protein KBC48_02655 [Candidatus Pacebacteria bacterium]|nr:hypothetical protein [Candidatus Paceibacterota bacterium]